MDILKIYRHGSNALYVREQLKSHGIISFIEEDNHKELKFKLLVKEKDRENAERILTELGIDDNEVSPESDGYLLGHREWTDRMYDPGHYTGDKIPHYLLDKANWKIYGPFFLIMGVTMMYLLVKSGIDINDGEIVIFTLLYIITGYSMIKQLRKRKK